MRTNMLTTCFALFFIIASSAQIKNDDILFTVGETSVFAKEFLRVYNKNLDLVKDESQKDVNEYLKLFVNYKLKLAEARALDYHQKPQYVRELNGYKKQLAKNYLTDHKVTDALVKEAYERVSYDVEAKHILIMLDASQKDTLATYNRILGFRDKLKTEDFAKVQQELHNGSTVLVEDLGYFSGFKMVYDFENAAFNTNVGEVSMPFRTQFGYHIVKIYNKRESRGEVTVGHIMISNNQKDPNVSSEGRINEINNLLTQGGDFESLAKQFSEDKSSAKKGGKLNPFKSGQLSSVKFEDVAFSLNKEGEISAPFQSDYGWHIIKLYNKKANGSFDEMRYDLENMVKRDSRSKLINTSVQKRLQKQYNISNVNEGRDYFVSILSDAFYSRAWRIPETMDKQKVLFAIGAKKITYGDFAYFLRSKQKGISKAKSLEAIVDEGYKTFLDREVLKYHEENLENVNEEFANILNEYREGLLLFDLMETKIWNAVKNDTIGINNHYEANKQNYINERHIEAVIATASREKDIKQVRRLLNKGENIEAIKTALNKNNDQRVIFTSGDMFDDHQALPKDFSFEEGVSEIYVHNNAFNVVKVNKVVPESIKTLNEAKGLVISDYQQVVENKWLDNLSQKYKVTINHAILEKVKNQINK